MSSVLRVSLQYGTANRKEAQECLDTCAPISGASTDSANAPPTRQDAVVRWCEGKADKATAHEDRVKFQWLDRHLRNRQLHTITRDEIQAIGKAKAAESSRTTANRYLALPLRAAAAKLATFSSFDLADNEAVTGHTS